MKPSEVVERALDQFNELASVPGGEHDIADGRVQVWALFDRDQHPSVLQAFAAAEGTGLHLGFSHPSFDLWLLLHFQNMMSAEGGSSTAVHAKLRAADHAYSKFARNGDKSVTGARARSLLGREGQAAAHARKLVDDCPSGTCTAANGHGVWCPPLNRDPSTDLWRLLEALEVIPPG